MKNEFLDAMFERFKDRDRRVTDLFAPRRYAPPHDYMNPRLLAPILFASCITKNPNEIVVNNMACAYKLAQYGVPTYFIAPEFGEAAYLTDPPENTLVGDIVWPLPAMSFVIPRALSVKLFGWYVPFISFCKIHKGDNRPPRKLLDILPRAKDILYAECDGVLVHAVLINEEFPMEYNSNAKTTELISKVVKYDNLKDDLLGERWEEAKRGLGIREMTHEEDIDLVQKVSRFAYNVIMAVSARPELMETMERPSRPASYHPKTREVIKDELWHPNMIGRRYVTQHSNPGGGHHASPRMHWRRGHFRNQKHGKGLSLTKLIWIEPVLVHG